MLLVFPLLLFGIKRLCAVHESALLHVNTTCSSLEVFVVDHHSIVMAQADNNFLQKRD